MPEKFDGLPCLSKAQYLEMEIFLSNYLKKITLLLRKLETAGSPGEIDSMALAGILSTQLVHQYFIDGFPRNAAIPIKPVVFIDDRINVPNILN